MTDILADPVLFGLLWAIAVLVGVLIGWNLRAAWPEREMARWLERTTQERNTLARLYTQIKHHYELREADLRKTAIELTSLREQVSVYESERAFLLTTAQANTTRMEKAEAAVAQWADRLPVLEAAAQRLQAENEALQAEHSRLQGQLNAWKTLHMGFSNMHQELRRLEEKTAILEQDRRQLREQLSMAHSEMEQQKRELLRYAEQLRSRPDTYSASASDGDTGPTQTPEKADDLFRIKGISDTNALRLHEMGVFSFVQISEWETEDVAEIAKALGISPTKIIQDDWVGQAQMLVAGPQP
jgi:predicted flap endonuclease-1-like 5' DNA nuclease